MFTKEELEELKEFDRQLDNEERLRQNKVKREWKKSTPEIREKIKKSNREYYLKNRERICARRKERWYTYEKALAMKKKMLKEGNRGEEES